MAGQISGQVTVATAGTAVTGPDLDVNGYVYFMTVPANTDVVYVGNDGSNDVASTTGYPLLTTGNTVMRWVQNLENLYFDAAVSGEKIAYFLQN